MARDTGAMPMALCRVLACRPGRVLLVAADTGALETATAALDVLLGIVGDGRSLIQIPEVVVSRRNRWLPENEAARCAALERALGPGSEIFATTPLGLLAPATPPGRFSAEIFTLRTGDRGSGPEEIAARLVGLDYDNEVEVHAPGEFARRGGILDVYSPLYEAPVRIEFFGDEIDSMRFFLPDTQRSYGETAELRIVPRGDSATDPGEAGACVHDYFGSDCLLVVLEPARVRDHLERFADEDAPSAWEGIVARTPRRVFLEQDTDAVRTPAADDSVPCITPDCFAFGEELGALIPELGEGGALWHWQQLRGELVRRHAAGYALVACFGREGESDRFREMLNEDPKTRDLPVVSEVLRLDTGLLLPSARLVLLSERELFGKQPDVRRRRTSRYRIENVPEEGMGLEEGVYAVHAGHGICLFHGVRELEVNGELQEVLELEFDDDAKLYVPLDQAHLVSRYVGGTKKLPKLSRLGGVSWKNAKANAAAAAWDLAAELLRMEAVRQASRGFALGPSPDWEHSFAAAFPYTETDDQAEAITAVLADMESPKPMDRLLCGDVGYGKTEVAMRAAFRTVLNGKQVAVLVPTTVLAQQHFCTFRERMAEYPIAIEAVSRLRTRGEQNRVLERVAGGEVDIIIGTHRLLQKDVRFAELGLVIVDEEQRFGVLHKQKLKQFRASVDILTMTATPIPRTLYMSLSGLRNLSTIMTAPAERLPVQTIVASYDADLIRTAILHELERGGQVFFLHNRVRTIERIAYRLRQLVPEARFAVGHGRMSAHGLEEVMASFVRGEVDVLVCTTIIESGIDIPNANTIIIDRADRFGLAELYQLRGRVGRYHHQAYAYLLLPPAGLLTGDARERLAAIRRYTHLGAGFKLAMRDLEIRGAGNILGPEQSGHIAAVGFEMYSELLKEAVSRMSKRAAPQPARVEVELDSIVFGYGDARGRPHAAFTRDYIASESLRIESYRRLSGLQTTADVDAFAAELRDRFGPVPPSASRLLTVARIRAHARRLGVFRIDVKGQRVYLETERGLLKLDGRTIPQLRAVTGHEQLEELEDLLGRRAAREPAA